jgi:hypothetical protein
MELPSIPMCLWNASTRLAIRQKAIEILLYQVQPCNFIIVHLVGSVLSFLETNVRPDALKVDG